MSSAAGARLRRLYVDELQCMGYP